MLNLLIPIEAMRAYRPIFAEGEVIGEASVSTRQLPVAVAPCRPGRRGAWRRRRNVA